MSSGNAIVDALDGLSAEVAKCTAAVKSADPTALKTAVQTAASIAAGEVRQALTANREAAADVLAAAQQARQAATAAAEAGEALGGMGWKLMAFLALLLVLVGFCLGVVGSVRMFPASLMATRPGCTIVGGQFIQAVQGRNPDGCWVAP
ncbi:MAG: hypothetical protein HQK99_17570 [Nitrospirae bacterium]|nr:hypothetical protein [Nitrospirota bacterium]MBF0477362.1 hypothetical protein [Deltaproteobacteria bacterium]